MNVVRLARVLTPVAVALAAAAVAAAPASAGPVPDVPMVMSHKGVHYPFSSMPELSTGAIDKSAALGVPSEIDILLSKPTKSYPAGVPFVFHDQTVDRMTKQTGPVTSFTPAELANMCLVTKPNGDVCSDYKIPRLATVLKRSQAAGVPLDIEIKHATLTWRQALSIVKRLERADAWTWDVLPGFDAPMILSQWSQPLAQLREVALHRGDPPLLTEFLTVNPAPAPEDTVGSSMVAVFYKNITPDVVTNLHNAGLLVDAYTTNKSESWTELATADVDWVITDDVRGYLKWAAGTP